MTLSSVLELIAENQNYFPAGAGSRYRKNLNILLSRLRSRTPETGFALEYVGTPKQWPRVEAIATKTYFAKGEVKLAKSESTLYGLVQCASDISPADCKTCMGELMARIPDYTGKGGQFLSATCTLQYEFYRFFNA
ncbi:antimicrobial ginkbilobin-2-like protein [Coffea arabica]|uniref:Antimicrobial ginkbilobin-2-like protein n=1 Tax=Coffea arabica TaxID=13443 RepID=A0A6P6UBI1_COFAR|nr:putative cysteine-rich repeat secretory protein 22 [Coffea arabica]